jgi:beta-galactosidase/beta-glucuronidase
MLGEARVSAFDVEDRQVHPHPHPCPQMRRQAWTSLDGEWDFANGRGKLWTAPRRVQWDQKIIIPFSPETEASGIHDTGFYRAVWYRRQWEQPRLLPSERLLLHFEAVDWRATVWVNGHKVATHEGGYTPFAADITEALIEAPQQEVVVRAEDDYADLSKPRGKQDWKLDPHSIWYPRTTGIWQTVWLETVNATRIRSVHWSSSLDRWEIGLEAMVIDESTSEDEAISEVSAGQTPSKRALDRSPARALQLSVRLTAGEQLLANDTYTVIAGEVHRRIALSDPGIDDFRNALLWSPASPTLIEAELELRGPDGQLLDSVCSYTALRSVATQSDRFVLNGRPLTLRLVLDQGYWLRTGLTAPDDAALRKDIELVKQMGFNGVRKHQKIESARFLYWADRMGLLVWEEMPSAYRYTAKSIHRLTREWLEVLERDRSHPCIVAWVPFNESWGVPDLPESPAQRHYVQSLYHLTKALDPSRPVIGNDGWESVATDMIGIHDYDDQPDRIGRRYGSSDVETHLLKRERPGGRILTLGGESVACTQPIILTEFGGIAYGGSDDESWGYSRSRTAEQLLGQYRALLESVRSAPALAGFCYTQFTDTYQEVNGLLYADRTPKAPLEAIAQATCGTGPGPAVDYERQVDTAWKEHIMQR